MFCGLTDSLLSYYRCSRLSLIATKPTLQILSLFLLLTLASPLLSTAPPYPTAHASARTISLVANIVGGYYYWNSTNPTITVTQGDSITLDLSSSSGTHKFLLDFDGDGVSDINDCPSTDPCTSSFATSATISFTANTAGSFMYYCTIHYPSMVGNFVVQAAATPGFSITPSPASLAIQQGSTGTSTITLASLNGFSGSLTLSQTTSPSEPSVSFNPTSVTLSSGGTATSTVTVSAMGGLYSSVAAGNYAVTVTATNGTLTHSATIQVAVASTSTSPAGSLNLPLTALVGVAVVLVVAVAVTVFLVRRKSR